MPADGFIPPHGGYENLLSFRKARIVYDGTVRSCERFFRQYLHRTPGPLTLSPTFSSASIHQTNYLPDQQLRALERAFLEEGGLRERMMRVRLEARRKHGGSP